MKPFLFLAAYGLGLWCVLDFAPPAPAQADASAPLLCGIVGADVNCATNVAANCHCASANNRCKQPHRETYSRPITYESYFGGCAFEIKQKSGACYRRYECNNSAGEDLGLCSSPNETKCYENQGTWVDVGTQTYYEEVGNCPDDETEPCPPI